MKDRGMKKYLPYKSLVEQESFLNSIKHKRTLVKKPILMEEEEEEINRALTSLKKGDFVKIKFFQNGEILFHSDYLKQIIPSSQIIILKTKTILLKDVLGVKKL